MASELIDLWPDDMRVKDEETPSLLLRHQATLLGERMRGRVEAEVVTQPLPGGRLAHGFRLKATALGGYVHTLFFAVHRHAQPYPVEIHMAFASAETETDPMVLCQDEESFEVALRDLFASPETRKAVEALLAA